MNYRRTHLRDVYEVKPSTTDHSEVEQLNNGGGSTINEQPDQDLVKQRLNSEGRQSQVLSRRKTRTWR